LVIVSLPEAGGRLDRSGFDCGEPALDRYFREQASQDMRRRIANCFVALAAEGMAEAVDGEEGPGVQGRMDSSAVAGFYTLASASIPVRDLPEDLARRLPRYPVLPAIRIGRLAVDRRFQGQGIGSVLLIDAMQRALRADAAGFTLLVDAKHEQAAAFYRHHGFTDLDSRPGTLFLPLATAGRLLAPGQD
jgi:GNAT superfamily N-acetyltransferase